MIDLSSSIAAFTGVELRVIQLKFQSIAAIVPRDARFGAFGRVLILFVDTAPHGDQGNVDWNCVVSAKPFIQSI